MIFVGDIHGNISVITNHIIRLNMLGIKNQNYIQLGDFGIGFLDEYTDMERLTNLNYDLKESDSRLFIIRGNHDNPKFWKDYFEFSNIFFIKDYTILNIEDNNIFLFGGGISIDRMGRVLNKNYWKEEIISGINDEFLNNIKNIDIVVSHIPPLDIFNSFLNPSIVKNWAIVDNTLNDDLKKERIIIKNIHDVLLKNNDIKYWFSGHFHLSHKIEMNKTIYRVLDIDEFYSH